MSLFICPLREVECNQRDLVDGAILVDVRIRGRAKQAGLNVIKRAWWFRTKAVTLVIWHNPRCHYLRVLKMKKTYV